MNRVFYSCFESLIDSVNTACLNLTILNRTVSNIFPEISMETFSHSSPFQLILIETVLFLNIFQPVQSLNDVLKPIQSLNDVWQPIQSPNDVLQPNQDRSDVVQPIQSLSDVLQPIQSLSDVLQPIQGYFTAQRDQVSPNRHTCILIPLMCLGSAI